MPKKLYESELKKLQAQLVDLQAWVHETGARIVVLFEGRDAAGKGSTIKRIQEYLNPRITRVVALPTPSQRDQTRWYFQRYVSQLPSAGEIVLFDRSWYNRAGVEHVMGYCTNEQYHRFLHQAPIFERMLVEDGIILLKYWFSVSDIEQENRFNSRNQDPMRRWKLSPNDVLSITKWEDYSRAKDTMLVHTDIPEARWFEIDNEDKRRGRINMISHLLSRVPYQPVEREPVVIPTRPASKGYERPPRDESGQVPDVARQLEAEYAARKAAKAQRKQEEAAAEAAE
ncbi:MAG: polyphosphate kinase 2 [Microbacterium sp.]|uniref:polyphosphate kinase 2 n=1 Tax=Microbacterium sp. TaxID=51671 RepID=UPI0039E5AAEC